MWPAQHSDPHGPAPDSNIYGQDPYRGYQDDNLQQAVRSFSQHLSAQPNYNYQAPQQQYQTVDSTSYHSNVAYRGDQAHYSSHGQHQYPQDSSRYSSYSQQSYTPSHSYQSQADYSSGSHASSTSPGSYRGPYSDRQQYSSMDSSRRADSSVDSRSIDSRGHGSDRGLDSRSTAPYSRAGDRGFSVGRSDRSQYPSSASSTVSSMPTDSTGSGRYYRGTSTNGIRGYTADSDRERRTYGTSASVPPTSSRSYDRITDAYSPSSSTTGSDYRASSSYKGSRDVYTPDRDSNTIPTISNRYPASSTYQQPSSTSSSPFGQGSNQYGTHRRTPLGGTTNSSSTSSSVSRDSSYRSDRGDRRGDSLPYVAHIRRYVVSKPYLNALDLKHQHPELELSNDLVGVKPNWVATVPLRDLNEPQAIQLNLPLPCAIDNTAVPTAPTAPYFPPNFSNTTDGPAGRTQVRIILVRGAPVDISASKGSFVHISSNISFLVLERKSSDKDLPTSLYSLGGIYNPSLDGVDEVPNLDLTKSKAGTKTAPESTPEPTANPPTSTTPSDAILIKTAIRIVKDQVGLDLSGCSSWYRFMEIEWARDGTSVNDRAVYFIPSVWELLPSPETFAEKWTDWKKDELRMAIGRDIDRLTKQLSQITDDQSAVYLDLSSRLLQKEAAKKSVELGPNDIPPNRPQLLLRTNPNSTNESKAYFYTLHQLLTDHSHPATETRFDETQDFALFAKCFNDYLQYYFGMGIMASIAPMRHQLLSGEKPLVIAGTTYTTPSKKRPRPEQFSSPDCTSALGRSSNSTTASTSADGEQNKRSKLSEGSYPSSASSEIVKSEDPSTNSHIANGQGPSFDEPATEEQDTRIKLEVITSSAADVIDANYSKIDEDDQPTDSEDEEPRYTDKPNEPENGERSLPPTEPPSAASSSNQPKDFQHDVATTSTTSTASTSSSVTQDSSKSFIRHSFGRAPAHRDYKLMQAYRFFDLNRLGIIKSEDLEDAILSCGVEISRKMAAELVASSDLSLSHKPAIITGYDRKKNMRYKPVCDWVFNEPSK